MNSVGFRENLHGIVSVTACNLLFLINDTFNKIAGETLPLTEVVFLRGLMSIPFLLVLVLATGAQQHTTLLWNRGMFVRMVSEVIGTLLFLTAVIHIPIANANTILQIIPLAITAAGALLLGEAVGWRRWTAIVVGFIGVLVVVRPGLAGFDAYSFYAVAAVVFITARDMSTRFIPAALPALLVALASAVCVTSAAPVVGLALRETWVWPSAHQLGLATGAAVFLIAGHITAVDFMRHGDISVVAPFRYTVILWSMIVGYLVWRDVPDTLMILGTVIIAATGVYTFRRERNLARLAREADAGEGF